MSDNYVQVQLDGTGKKIQTFENVVNTQPVEAQAVVAVTTAGAPLIGQKTSANSSPVVIASDQSAISVSVSSLPLPSGAATETTLGQRLADATFTARINTQGQKAMSASTPVAIASDQSALAVTPPTLTKGTQGSTGISVQSLKEAGRTLKTWSVTALAGVTTEALISLTPYSDLTAGSAGTSFTVTAGKKLVIQRINLVWRNNTAAAGGVTVRFRMLNGTVLIGSPVHITLHASSTIATIGSGSSSSIEFPDGLELSGSMQFGCTQIAVGAVVGFDLQINGYEY